MSLFFINLDKNFIDRFDMGKFFQFTDNYDPLTSDFADELMKLTTRGNYIIQGQDGRPDLISQAVYGDTQYWWIIMLYNTKLQFLDLKSGDVINFPSLDDVESLFFSLKSRESSVK